MALKLKRWQLVVIACLVLSHGVAAVKLGDVAEFVFVTCGLFYVDVITDVISLQNFALRGRW